MCTVNEVQTKILESVISGKYVFGMDNQIYIDGPNMLHGKFLIHAAKTDSDFHNRSKICQSLFVLGYMEGISSQTKILYDKFRSINGYRTGSMPEMERKSK